MCGDRHHAVKHYTAMISDRLKQARMAKGLSLEALGQMLEPNITRSAVSNWEHGRAEPSLKTLYQLANILDTSVSWLIGDIGESETPRDPHILSRPLLAAAAEALERHLQHEGLQLDPRDYARTLLAVYDWAEGAGMTGIDPIDLSAIKSLLRLASSGINR